jgi:hypothetical protein
MCIWSEENPQIIQQVLLYSVKIEACVVSVPPIIGPIFFQGSMNSDWHVRVILNPFFNQLTAEGGHCGYS